MSDLDEQSPQNYWKMYYLLETMWYQTSCHGRDFRVNISRPTGYCKLVEGKTRPLTKFRVQAYRKA